MINQLRLSNLSLSYAPLYKWVICGKYKHYHGIILTNPLDPQIYPHQRFSYHLRSQTDQVTAAGAAEATACPSPDVFRASSPGAGTVVVEATQR